MTEHRTKTPQYDVAIVGAGFAGLYLLLRCRTLGLTARIWEKGTGVGGVWYWNRYPGARCDVESMQYCYSFDEQLQQEWNWSERYSPQPEILGYLQHVARRFDLLDGIDFERHLAKAQFDNSECVWTLTAVSGESLTARFCVMATGCLSEPNWPLIDGYDDFAGPVYHTALWPHEDVDFHGKRVAVIGTGSSGIQSIPLIAEEASQLTVFQRTANYSIPAQNGPLDKAQLASVKSNYAELRERAKTRHNAIEGQYSKVSALSVGEEERTAEYERRWKHGGLTFLGAFGDLLSDEASNATLAGFVRDKIRSTVKDPQVAEKLIPVNIIGGKRLCVDTNYFATYNKNHVQLIDLHADPILNINKRGLCTAKDQYDVDIIVVATGFDAMTGALNRIDIRGRSGRALSDRWQSGPSTYLGLAMADYPNLFTVTGPGSPSVLTNMVPSIEHHVQWITDCISYVQSQKLIAIEATESAQHKWWEHVQDVGRSGIKHTTKSWYVGANIEGKANVFLPYNGGFPAYCRKCAEVVENDYEGFVFSSVPV